MIEGLSETYRENGGDLHTLALLGTAKGTNSEPRQRIDRLLNNLGAT